MPPLITGIMAAIKKEPDIVLGNCIGNNLFNILFVLGTSAVIFPIHAGNSLWIDVAAMLFLTAFIFLVSLLHKSLRRKPGIFLLFIYIVYLVTKMWMALAV